MVCPPCSRHRPHRNPEAHMVAPATGCTAQAAEAGGNGVAAAIDYKSTTTNKFKVQGSSNKHHISKNTVPGTGRTRENMRQGNRKVAEPSPLTEGPKKGPCSSGGEVSG